MLYVSSAVKCLGEKQLKTTFILASHVYWLFCRLKRTCVAGKMKELYVCHNINHPSNIIIAFGETPITLDHF